ncbi:MAG: hypothetical protein DLM53_01655 [Candidatus Eremiobacter antarcticus]|nr:HD domain-containing protein [Candidatus Eremiobacteraeota bacterium]PZR63510.1 MAG: hypothetical protein DLM53_01655 [Candidatus Eremiobacter sp. RRmetagenome_bin22]
MALAGHVAEAHTDAWRSTASQVYLYGLAAAALCLLIFVPLHFDLSTNTLVSVIIVAVFLVAMERPTRTAVSTVAPLTAILAASGVALGPWMMVLAAIALLTVRFRVDGSKINEFLTPISLGQLGIAVLSSYALIESWQPLHRLTASTPALFHSALTFFSVLVVSMVTQTVNNVLVYVYFQINERPVLLSQLLRVGVVASIYAYILVAIYTFGGIIGATIFYVVVAQIKFLQDILGITVQLHKLEKAQSQAQALVRDLARLTDTETVEFSSEVQNISQMMARRLGMPKKELELTVLAAALHEIGKSNLPARLRKGVDLNQKETAQYLTFGRWGGLMIRSADALLPPEIADLIEFQREHYDGTGYPRGLQEDAIPLPSRIIAVAHQYVNLLTGYDGCEPLNKPKALARLREGSGTLYDPKLVSLLDELVN